MNCCSNQTKKQKPGTSMLYVFIEQVIRSEKNCDVRRVVWCEGSVLFVCVCLFFHFWRRTRKGFCFLSMRGTNNYGKADLTAPENGCWGLSAPAFASCCMLAGSVVIRLENF